MSYTALYRKFRPDTFEDVKGQEHIVTTLKNQIKADRIGHAYLFCGTRGTGKTTVAKILAKAVNCENLKDGSPCNECAACKAIAAGASMNVVEIDAASNNGVDNIRQIREEVQYPPTSGKYRVYIIDEVHMLSIGAFNALLKTLEEPPSYVIFILATTEAHKIPVTILSRCQRYDFKRISIDVISDRIKELTEKENIEIEERAVRYIAKLADGAMRDALSLLDQCVAFYLGEKLTYDHVLEVLGAVDTGIFSTMLRSILNGEAAKAIENLENVIMSGRDLSQFIIDFTWYIRNLLLVKTSAEECIDIIDVTQERLSQLMEEAEMTDEETLMRYIRILSELSNTIKYSTSKRVLVEVAIIKMIRPAMENDISSLVNRISDVERKIEKGEITVKASVAQAEKTKLSMKEEIKAEKIIPPAVSEDIRNVADNWLRIENRLGGLLKAAIRRAVLKPGNDNELILEFEDGTDKAMVATEKNIEIIENAIQEETQKKVKVVIRLQENDKMNNEDRFSEALKNIKIDKLEQEDF